MLGSARVLLLKPSRVNSIAIHMRSNVFVPLAVTLLPLSLAAIPARAADHFLTIGGGHAPSGNPVSLEKNVLFFRSMLGDLYDRAATPPHDVFFSDGDSPGHDVQYDDPDSSVPEANRLLAQLDDDEDDLNHQYRSHAIDNVRGPASLGAVRKWFAETGSKIPRGDRLILYATGHGGYERSDDGDKKWWWFGAGGKFDNNYLNLWNGEVIDVQELARLLDSLPTGVDVVVVMVQCYSGGFADLVFAGGKPANGPAAGTRCGFFSTMPDRQAAGCTPSVNEEDYRDYSSGFWAAFHGKTRTDVAVDDASRDFDGDGVVTFAEAHAHVLLTDDSIDIPMTMSDRFLRLQSDPGASRGGLLSPEDMFDRLRALATPAERAVIDGLSTQLDLAGGQYRYAAAKELDESLTQQYGANKTQKNALRKQFDTARNAIRSALRFRWPELESRWNPAVDRILREESEAVIDTIKADSHYPEFVKHYTELGELSDRDAVLGNKSAKCQRLMHTLERIALAHNLEKVADEATVARYRALIAAENGTLGTGQAKAAP